METTIDGAGRVVVPRSLRDGLGLTGGRDLEVVVRDGRLELEPPPVPMRLDQKRGVAVAAPDASMPR